MDHSRLIPITCTRLLGLHAIAFTASVLGSFVSTRIWQLGGGSMVVIAAVSLVCGVLMLAASITSEKRRNTAWALWLLFFNVLPYALVLVAGRATGL